MATAIGFSPRVPLYLFGSKDELPNALLTRARIDELPTPAPLRHDDAAAADLIARAEQAWSWLSAPEHRPVLTLWMESYARSLAHETVDDWLGVLRFLAARSAHGAPMRVRS